MRRPLPPPPQWRRCTPFGHPSGESLRATVSSVDAKADVQMLPLRQPRPLTPHERELLDFLLAGPVDSPDLRAQAATAVVAGVCSCGCPSIRLAVDENAPRARLD